MRMFLFALVLAAGCSTSPTPAPVVPTGGTQIYVGSTFATDGEPMFRYTRESQVQDDSWTSVHTTHSVRDGGIVVSQAAEHDASYKLHRYIEDHRQQRIRSEVVAQSTGTLVYTTHKRGRVRHRQERLRAPAVTGPTLFGFVAAHWDRLSSGEQMRVQFVVAERRRSYGFTLTMAGGAPDSVVVTMRARSPLLRLSVPPMRMTFDPETRAVVRYEGRIPPRWEGRPVEARVEYEHVAPYR